MFLCPALCTIEMVSEVDRKWMKLHWRIRFWLMDYVNCFSGHWKSLYIELLLSVWLLMLLALLTWNWSTAVSDSRIILCIRPANARLCFTITPSVIGWVHTRNNPCRFIVDKVLVCVFWNCFWLLHWICCWRITLKTSLDSEDTNWKNSAWIYTN